jgi:hypothetical protein
VPPSTGLFTNSLPKFSASVLPGMSCVTEIAEGYPRKSFDLSFLSYYVNILCVFGCLSKETLVAVSMRRKRSDEVVAPEPTTDMRPREIV